MEGQKEHCQGVSGFAVLSLDGEAEPFGKALSGQSHI